MFKLVKLTVDGKQRGLSTKLAKELVPSSQHIIASLAAAKLMERGERLNFHVKPGFCCFESDRVKVVFRGSTAKR